MNLISSPQVLGFPWTRGIMCKVLKSSRTFPPYLMHTILVSLKHHSPFMQFLCFLPNFQSNTIHSALAHVSDLLKHFQIPQSSSCYSCLFSNDTLKFSLKAFVSFVLRHGWPCAFQVKHSNTKLYP